MEARLQEANGDTVLEIVVPGETKTRLSLKTLLRHRGYFEDGITRFQEELKDVNAKIALIENEQAKQAK